MTIITVEPPRSKVTKYRIGIEKPEDWKIKAIAEYKQKKFMKEKVAQKVAQEQTALTKESDKVQLAQQIKNATSEQRQYFVEQTLNDIAILHNNGIIIKERIIALHSVKSSLLWLLKKSSTHERSLIHEHSFLPTGYQPTTK